EYFYPYFIFVKLTSEKIIGLKQNLYLNNKFIMDGMQFNGTTEDDRARNLIDERFNNDSFRPFRILNSIEDINNIRDRIKQSNMRSKRIQLLDFYRKEINIKPSDYEDVPTFCFQQDSINMLQEIIK
uniref:hypothetical protein n=1 Tax=Neisseria mucosa TaxID=488 RepID=UPI00197F6E24